MAEDNEEVKEKAPAEKAPVAGGKNPLVTIFLILNAIGLGVVAFLQFQSHQKMNQDNDLKDLVKAELAKEMEMKEQKKMETNLNPGKKAIEGRPFNLEPFTANLAQGEGPRRYVTMTTVLQFSEDSNEEEFKSRKAQIRDSVINILNTKRAEDLLKKEGKDYLKEEIKSVVNSYLIEGKVIDVYYINFQVN